jgi:transposase
VPLTGRNAKRVIFGALNLRTGRRHLLARLHGRREDFCAFLRALRSAYGRRPLALLLDANSCHLALRSLDTARRLKVHLLWLPTRSPHLNPMDHLWRDAKQKVCANRQYATIEDEVRRFLAHVWALSPRQALRKAGVLAPGFWLRGAMSKNFCGPT